MIETYSGVCIGGPRDGETISPQRPYFECIAHTGLPSLETFNQINLPSVQATVRKHVYRFVRRPPIKDEQYTSNYYGVFVYEETPMDWPSLILRLSEGYRRPNLRGWMEF